MISLRAFAASHESFAQPSSKLRCKTSKKVDVVPTLVPQPHTAQSGEGGQRARSPSEHASCWLDSSHSPKDSQVRLAWLLLPQIPDEDLPVACSPKNFFVRDMVESLEIEVPFVRTDDNIADFFTKPLKGKKFHAMRRIIMNER